MPYWIEYKTMPPCGFIKPRERSDEGTPKIICTSCGGGFPAKNSAKKHTLRYLCQETNVMTCSPNSDIGSARVSWYKCVQAEGKSRYEPTTKKVECPICFEEKVLVPVCENEHLVCSECEQAGSLLRCPICRNPAVTPFTRLYECLT